MSSKILSLKNVTKKFGGLTAVSNLSFDVNANEMVGVIGPNGSGKTTVMNLISGALRPTEGRILMAGRTISEMSAQNIARAGVGRTFQLVKLLNGLSVLENVTAGAVFGHRRRWGREAEHYALEMLELVGVEGLANHQINALTYIDQKRVELARTLAGEPRVLLLDEWLAGLNPSELITGINLIQKLRAEGKTVILVEHVMDAIRLLCDRCVVMSSGEKIAEGSPEEVLSDTNVIAAYLGDFDA
ncbi:MAG: ABC transporter ATP-binding protein [Paracoccaceae bacterium]